MNVENKTPGRMIPNLLVLLLLSVATWQTAHATSIFINEIHYDNVGADTGEGVEIAGPALTNLAGWELVLYNGYNGDAYKTISLNGILPDQQNGFGTLSFAFTGFQNGSPDGVALIDHTGSVVQFLSYEGSFTAIGGVADGLQSTDIGVSETASTTLGYSLQLMGTGFLFEDFSWGSALANTFAAINSGQQFTPVSPLVVPEPPALILLFLGYFGYFSVYSKPWD